MKIMIIACSLLFSLSVLSKEYGMAGCGLGSVIIGKEDNQLVALTTNHTGTQTFAISSGTSNCIPAGKAQQKLTALIEANRPVILTDIAKGNGETISVIGKIYGCGNTAELGEILQKNYADIHPENGASAQQMTTVIDRIIQKNENCKV